MKQRYKKQVQSVSYRIVTSEFNKDIHILLISGIEYARGDKKTIKSLREYCVRNKITKK